MEYKRKSYSFIKRSIALVLAIMLAIPLFSTLNPIDVQAHNQGNTVQGYQWYWQEIHRLMESNPAVRSDFMSRGTFGTDMSRLQFFSGSASSGWWNGPANPLVPRTQAHFRLERVDAETGQVIPFNSPSGTTRPHLLSYRGGQASHAPNFDVLGWNEDRQWEQNRIFGNGSSWWPFVPGNHNYDMTIVVEVGDILRFTDESIGSGFSGAGGVNDVVHNLQFGGADYGTAASQALSSAIFAEGASNHRGAGWIDWEIEITEEMIGEHTIYYSVEDWQRTSNVLNPSSLHAGRPWSPRPGGNAGGWGNHSQNGNHFVQGNDADGWFPGGAIYHFQAAHIRVVAYSGIADSIRIIRVFETWDSEGNFVERHAVDNLVSTVSPSESTNDPEEFRDVRNDFISFINADLIYQPENWDGWEAVDEGLGGEIITNNDNSPAVQRRVYPLEFDNNFIPDTGGEFGIEMVDVSSDAGRVISGQMVNSTQVPGLNFSELVGQEHEVGEPQFELVEWFTLLSEPAGMGMYRWPDLDLWTGLSLNHTWEEITETYVLGAGWGSSMPMVMGSAKGDIIMQTGALAQGAHIEGEFSYIRNELDASSQQYIGVEATQEFAGIPVIVGQRPNANTFAWDMAGVSEVDTQIIYIFYRRIVPPVIPSVTIVKIHEEWDGEDLISVEHEAIPLLPRFEMEDDDIIINWYNPQTGQYLEDGLGNGPVLTYDEAPVAMGSSHDFSSTNLEEWFTTEDRHEDLDSDRGIIPEVEYPDEPWTTPIKYESDYAWEPAFSGEEPKVESGEEAEEIKIKVTMEDSSPWTQVVYLRYINRITAVTVVIITEEYEDGLLISYDRQQYNLDEPFPPYYQIPPNAEEWFWTTDRDVVPGEQWNPVRNPEITHSEDSGEGGANVPIVVPDDADEQVIYIYIRNERTTLPPIEADLLLTQQRITRRVNLFNLLEAMDNEPGMAQSFHVVDRPCRCYDAGSPCTEPPDPAPGTTEDVGCTQNFSRTEVGCDACDNGQCMEAPWAVLVECTHIQVPDGDGGYTDICLGGGVAIFPGEWACVCVSIWYKWTDSFYQVYWQNMRPITHIIGAEISAQGADWGVEYTNHIAYAEADDIYQEFPDSHYLPGSQSGEHWYNPQFHNHSDVNWTDVEDGLYPNFDFLTYRALNLPTLSIYAYHPFFNYSVGGREVNDEADANHLHTGLANYSESGNTAEWDNSPPAPLPEKRQQDYYNVENMAFELRHDGQDSKLDMDEHVKHDRCDAEYEYNLRTLRDRPINYIFNMRVEYHQSQARSGQQAFTLAPRQMALFVGAGTVIDFPASQVGTASVQNTTPVVWYSHVEKVFDDLHQDDVPVYVMSDTTSTWRGNDSIEIGWRRQDPNNPNLIIDSRQWSGHTRARDLSGRAGNQPSGDAVMVLPGGAIFTVAHDTSQLVHIGVRTFQTFIEAELIDFVTANTPRGWSGFGQYRLAPRLEEHNRAVNMVVEDVEAIELGMWVNRSSISSNPFDGQHVFQGMSGWANGWSAGTTPAQRAGTTGIQLNADARYWLDNDNPAARRAQNTSAFFDAHNRLDRVKFYRMVAEVDGVITMQVFDAGMNPGWNATGLESSIDWTNLVSGTDIGAILANDEAILVNDATGLVTNWFAALERGTGNNRGEEDARVHGDGRSLDSPWYNQAFRGIGVIMIETSFEVSLTNAPAFGELDDGTPNLRQASVAPRLIPFHQGANQLMTYAFPSGYRSIDRDLLTTIGQITWSSPSPANIETRRLFDSNWFLIPNATVQDLR